MGKKHQSLLASQKGLTERLRKRLRRKLELQRKQEKFQKWLEERTEVESREDTLQSILEGEAALYEKIDVDSYDGDGDGDDYMDAETAVDSNDDLDGIPNLSPQSRRSSLGRPSALTRKTADHGKT